MTVYSTIGCRGWLCDSSLSLNLTHFSPLHTAECFALIPATFLLHWWLAYHLMHPDPRPHRRLLWALALSSSYVHTWRSCTLSLCTRNPPHPSNRYLYLIVFWIPWQPYWIRELHVMACLMSVWKLLELALLRCDEQLRTPWVRCVTLSHGEMPSYYENLVRI